MLLWGGVAAAVIVLVVLSIVFILKIIPRLSSKEATASAETRQETHSQRSARKTVAPVAAKPEDIARALESGLHVTGTVLGQSRSETFGLGTQTHFEWKVALQVTNNTPFRVDLGTDLVLVESDGQGRMFEGVALFRVRRVAARGMGDSETREEDVPFCYELSNYEIRDPRGHTNSRMGNMLSWTVLHSDSTAVSESEVSFGSAPPGGQCGIEHTLKSGAWLKSENRASVRVALPEISVATVSGPVRFRLIARFSKPADDSAPWTVTGRAWVPMQSEPLSDLLESPQNDVVTRVFAAGWLSNVVPVRARPSLARVGRTMHDGSLLAACIELLTRLKGNDMAEHAASLLRNEKAPNGIRQMAAVYVGTVGHQAALSDLIALTDNNDDVIVKGAIQGLGCLGGDDASKRLLEMLADSKFKSRAALIANSLVKTRSATALNSLKDLARGGNDNAMRALSGAGNPDMFDFFVEMTRANKNPKWTPMIARGLRLAGGERAIPSLLQLLKEEPPPTTVTYVSTGREVVDEVAALNSPQMVPAVVELAQSGHVPALLVLARCTFEQARDPLLRIAKTASGNALEIALGGLASHWPRESVEHFKTALNSSSTEIVRTAARGLGRSQDSSAVPLLLPLLQHSDRSTRFTAADALETLDPGANASQLLNTILATDDDQIAARLATGLINHKWRDKQTIASLSEKLATAKGAIRYQYIRLLRHLSDNAQGPATYPEFEDKADEWSQKWIGWAAQR